MRFMFLQSPFVLYVHCNSRTRCSFSIEQQDSRLNNEFKNPRFLRLKCVNQSRSPIVALRVRALLQFRDETYCPCMRE